MLSKVGWLGMALTAGILPMIGMNSPVVAHDYFLSIPVSTENTFVAELPDYLANDQGSSNPLEGATTSVTSTVSASIPFSLDLFSRVVQDYSQANILISPLSVQLALGMTLEGAAGETQAEIAKVLGIAPDQLAEWHRTNQKRLVELTEATDNSLQLQIANSLWLAEGIPIFPEFIRANQDYYQAQVNSVTFGQPAATNRINDWVAENTAGKITSIVDRTEPDTLLMLLNTVYFKGNWRYAFDPTATRESIFTLANGQEKQHPFMEQSGTYRYAESTLFQAIQLPYGEGEWVMTILLPQPEQTLAEVMAQLNPTTWQAWMNSLRSTQGSLQLPSFRLESSVALESILAEMGMPQAFRPTANFSQMSAQPTYISQVKHKAMIEVNEVGTEAAAVTAITMTRTSMSKQPPFSMVVNRPFLYAIQSVDSGEILFMGSVVNPER
ncbi:MAG: serpin family protein [Cyanobacteriota bacterium]|nr:serpin family protein [Cyanobacteriota bacterium]